MPDLTVAIVYPELLGLYADRGNAIALRHRAELRGLSCEVRDIHLGEALPEAVDVYIIGGGEDAALGPAIRELRSQRALVGAPDRGAVVLGVCAGFQLLGRRLEAPDGSSVEGLGMLDIESRPLPDRRAVGEIAVQSPLLGELQGFENHRGDALLGEGVTPIGTVEHGVGNGHGNQEGAIDGNVVGTYLHGPALVRNPVFADYVLAGATGAELEPVEDELVERLRAERRAALVHERRGRRRRRW
ncbi:MAG: glutamine amidotransferase [Nocardioidaceae bacterium]|nr:glutamine amidotransferase [Nocardioidaceae bacterium]MCL2614291.1 glutamine amidotransferase [Nocardioidaceae bacterium]